MTIDSVIREALRVVVREEVRAAVRDEIAMALRPHSGASLAGSNEAYLSTEEAASIAKVEPATIREWVRRGDLQRHHAGRHLRIRRDNLERYLEVGRRPEGEQNVEDLATRILAKSNKRWG